MESQSTSVSSANILVKGLGYTPGHIFSKTLFGSEWIIMQMQSLCCSHSLMGVKCHGTSKGSQLRNDLLSGA